MQLLVVCSDPGALQWAALQTFLCAGLAFAPFRALARPAHGSPNPPHAKPAFRLVTGNIYEQAGRSSEADAKTPMRDSGNRLIRVDNITAQNSASNSSDLKTLLVPSIIIYFSGSWGRTCEKEFPPLDCFYRNHVSEDFEARAIRLISNDRSAAVAARLIEKHDTTFPVYFDTEQPGFGGPARITINYHDRCRPTVPSSGTWQTRLGFFRITGHSSGHSGSKVSHWMPRIRSKIKGD